MPQKRFGWYFSISGVSVANSLRLRRHTLWKFRVACKILSSPLLYVFFAYASRRFASLHFSSYQGANVFPHLLGLRGWDHFTCFTTPAINASYIINYSTACALSSLDYFTSDIICWSLSINAVSCVWVVHICADLLYSDILSPSIHL
jgi:hypothetical protein